MNVNDLPLDLLGGPMQLGERVYQVLRDGIVSGKLNAGRWLRVDQIGEQFGISSTPVRDALSHLEKDGLLVKHPYQGWAIRDFEDKEIRDLYELRAGLEGFGVRLACKRISEETLQWLREHQDQGEMALVHQDMEAYRIYNQELHTTILDASHNHELVTVMDKLRLQFQMLMAQTIRVHGRPARAVQEHAELVELIAKQDAQAAGQLMERHILSALEDILRYRFEQARELTPPGKNEELV